MSDLGHGRMDALIWLRRALQRPVEALGLRPLAQSVFRRMLALRYGESRLARVRHNGRIWILNTDLALRAENIELETIEWLRSVVRPGDCVVDIGANLGEMTLEAAVLTGPVGRVIAVEPAPGNVMALRTHINANGLSDRVTVVEAACGAASGGVITLHVLGENINALGNGHNVRQPAHAGHWSKVDVPATSVDQLTMDFGVRPAVIKIDVEGAELEVLRGCIGTLKELRPALRFAFHPFAFEDPRHATADIQQLLDSCGYSVPKPDEGDAYGLAEYVSHPQ